MFGSRTRSFLDWFVITFTNTEQLKNNGTKIFLTEKNNNQLVVNFQQEQ